MRVGIFGGTFNPIHLGHLRLAELARERCALDQVLFLPAADPPHKAVAGEASFADRMAMVGAAISDHPAFVLSDLESQRPGKSYSVQTLEILRQNHPDDELYFLIGMDSFRDIASWWDYRRLFTLAHLVVVPRPGVAFLQAPERMVPVAMMGEFCYDAGQQTLLHRSGMQVILLTEDCLDISSTAIRQRLAEGRSVRYLLPSAVTDYISIHGLYRAPKGHNHLAV